MASQAQVEANRANAAKSTGPKTDEGKAAVSQNAVKHGLLAELVVIKGEDPGEFEFYRQAMMGELCPVGEIESMLAERAVGLAWRLRRAERIQAEVVGTLLADTAKANHLKKMTRMALPRKMREGMDKADEGQTELGEAVVRDYANYRVLDRLGLYETRIERSFFKTLGELERRRMMRNVEGASNSSEGTRGLRTHPTSDSEKLDTNASNRNEVSPARGSVKAEGLGDGEARETRGLRTHATSTAPDTVAKEIQTNPIEAPGVLKTVGIDG